MHAGGSTGTGPVSAEPATGNAQAANPRASAMNHLERLLPMNRPSSDLCQWEEKAKGNKTCGESLERGRNAPLLRSRYGELRPDGADFDRRRALGLVRGDARDHAHVGVRTTDHDGEAAIEFAARVRRE